MGHFTFFKQESMTLDEIFWNYDMEFLTIHHQVRDRKFHTVKEARKHFIQAVKDRVRQMLSEDKIKFTILEYLIRTQKERILQHTARRFGKNRKVSENLAKAIHTEMDKAVEKL